MGGDDSDLKVGGFSGAVVSGGGKESQAPIGNSEYQAPEIMMNQGFDKSSDIWSVGCLLYFLINGTSPFKDSNTMRMNMKIRQGTFEFGDAWAKVSPSLKDLISKLIVTDPSKRLSADDVLKHTWFTVIIIFILPPSFSFPLIQFFVVSTSQHSTTKCKKRNEPKMNLFVCSKIINFKSFYCMQHFCVSVCLAHSVIFSSRAG